MLVYLSKKIAIPNDIRIRSLAWHSVNGWLAVGGEGGLLRVLKLELQNQDKDSKIKGLAAPSSLSMNQTLDAHIAGAGTVLGVTWNEPQQKLTSCDENGLIVVWLLHRSMWYEEMVNNRNRSSVSHMRWNREGQKICIVYQDGAVIVGSVDGNRVWGKELRSMNLTHVQWSPDSRVILFGNSQGEILIYDSHGAYNAKLTLHCLVGVTGVVKVAGVEWYNGCYGYIEPNCPCLAIAFDNGRAQIMRHELDNDPIKINAGMSVTALTWSHTGHMLAVAGSQIRHTGSDKEISVVQFYTPFGDHLYSLRIPGKNLSAVAWEGSGLRVALGVGSFIYFANIRRDYQWAYFVGTLVYSFHKENTSEKAVLFWNIGTNERNLKMCKHLFHLVSCMDYCLLVTEVYAAEENDDELTKQYALLLCNSLGAPVNTKYIPMEPLYASISYTHIVVANSSAIFVWHYRTPSRLGAPEFTAIVTQTLEGQDRLVHVDDKPTGIGEPSADFALSKKMTNDPICCLTASDKKLVVGRTSGTMQVYSLPRVSLDAQFPVSVMPHTIGINSDSSRLSIIDMNGVLTLYQLSDDRAGFQLELERKEVWDLRWAEDNPDLFAMMEKTRMYIFRGTEPEEPIISSGSICCFKDLQVKVVLMDELMKEPENPSEDIVWDMDIKSLRDTRQLLSRVGINDCFQFINDNPHPRLWRLLAETALGTLNFDMAEKAFVRCNDYQGIQFVKKLKKLDSEMKQRVEIAAYFKRFDEAERLYLEMDRKDLALDLRMKLGDWFRVVQLLKTGAGVGDDVQMIQAWNAIGDYYADRRKWQHAITYYSQAGNMEKLAEGYYAMEDYANLAKLSESLPNNHQLLEELGKMFVTVGMANEAVEAFLKCNQVKPAVDCCVQLNQWDWAVSLAKQHQLPDVSGLLTQYAANLLCSGKVLSSIELYRKASRFADAAQLLVEAARLATKRKMVPSKIKKMYVLAGLLIEKHHDHTKQRHLNPTLGGQGGAGDKEADLPSRKKEIQSTLQGLLEDSGSLANIVDNAWRGAEAYHLLMLAQKHLYSQDAASSVKTAMLLPPYDDILPPVDTYSLLALSALASKHFHVASSAFIKLESLCKSESEHQEYEELAAQIFTRNPPKTKGHPLTCPSCETPFTNISSGKCPGCAARLLVCMGSGELLLAYQSWLCDTCKHRTKEDIAAGLKNCPLCHASITMPKST